MRRYQISLRKFGDSCGDCRCLDVSNSFHRQLGFEDEVAEVVQEALGSLKKFQESLKRKGFIKMVLEFLVKVAKALKQVLKVDEKVVVSFK